MPRPQLKNTNSKRTASAKAPSTSRNKGLDAVALHQAQQHKVYQESVDKSVVEKGKNVVGMLRGVP